MSLAETDAGPGRWPDFLILGAMKSGTTTLFGYLARHPGIYLSTPKEPQFFSRDEVYARGTTWYRELFAGATSGQICGEASTCYSRWPHFGDVAGRVARYVPKAKLVYQMRHPVDRAYSHYTHLMQERLVRGSGPVIDIEKAVDEIPEILDASRYALQISRYLAYFDREALFLTTFDDLVERPAHTLSRIQQFLAVPPRDLLAEGPLVENRWGDRLARVRTREGLARLRRYPGLSRLVDRVPKPMRRSVRAWVSHPALGRRLMRRQIHEHRKRLPPLSPQMRERLVAELAPATRELEVLLGRALPGWLL